MGGKGSGSSVIQDQEHDNFLVPSKSWVVTPLQVTLLQIRIKPFLTGQPKAMSPPSIKKFSEIPDPGMSNKAGNEQSS